MFLPRKLEKMKQSLEFDFDPPYDELLFMRRYEYSRLAVECDKIILAVRGETSLSLKDDYKFESKVRCCEFIQQAEKTIKKASF